MKQVLYCDKCDTEWNGVLQCPVCGEYATGIKTIRKMTLDEIAKEYGNIKDLYETTI